MHFPLKTENRPLSFSILCCLLSTQRTVPCVLVHISKLENRRVEKVEDVLNLGDMTWVKFMGFDEKGRANFSRKDALKEMESEG